MKQPENITFYDNLVFKLSTQVDINSSAGTKSCLLTYEWFKYLLLISLGIYINLWTPRCNCTRNLLA